MCAANELGMFFLEGGYIAFGIALAVMIDYLWEALVFGGCGSRMVVLICCATVIICGVLFYVAGDIQHTQMNQYGAILRNQFALDALKGECERSEEVLVEKVEETEKAEEAEEAECRKVEWRNGELFITFHVGSAGTATEEAEELRDTLSRDTPTPTSEIEPTAEFKDLLVSEEVGVAERVEFMEPSHTMSASMEVSAKARRGRKKIATQNTK
jgi:hypothetical protein